MLFLYRTMCEELFCIYSLMNPAPNCWEQKYSLKHFEKMNYLTKIKDKYGKKILRKNHKSNLISTKKIKTYCFFEELSLQKWHRRKLDQSKTSFTWAITFKTGHPYLVNFLYFQTVHTCCIQTDST